MRVHAEPCDEEDENGNRVRTWLVGGWTPAQGMRKGDFHTVAQGFRTRAEAREYAAKLNAENADETQTVAEKIFGVAEGKTTKEQRAAAKAVSFGARFGGLPR